MQQVKMHYNISIVHVRGAVGVGSSDHDLIPQRIHFAASLVHDTTQVCVYSGCRQLVSVFSVVTRRSEQGKSYKANALFVLTATLSKDHEWLENPRNHPSSQRQCALPSCEGERHPGSEQGRRRSLQKGRVRKFKKKKKKVGCVRLIYTKSVGSNDDAPLVV